MRRHRILLMQNHWPLRCSLCLKRSRGLCTLPLTVFQVILVSATMTKAVKRLADTALPDLLRIEASNFHKPTAGAKQEFRVLPQGGDKLQMLLELLQADVRKQRRVLVFCGSMDSCRAVDHACQDSDLPTVCYHGEMPIHARKESMAAFAGVGERQNSASHLYSLIIS